MQAVSSITESSENSTLGCCGSCAQSCMKCGVILAISTMQETESPSHKQCLIACAKQLGEPLQHEEADYWVLFPTKV